MILKDKYDPFSIHCRCCCTEVTIMKILDDEGYTIIHTYIA